MTAVDQIELRVFNTSFKQQPPASGEGPAGTLITYTFAALLHDEVVGSGTGYSLVVSEDTAHCSNSLELSGRGVILFGGAEGVNAGGEVISPCPAEVPILGGTGEFAAAAGTVSMTPLHGTSPLEHRLIFNLQWP
jgi:hypothetical protein